MNDRTGPWAATLLLGLCGCLSASVPDLPSERSFRLDAPTPWRTAVSGEYVADHRLLGEPVPYALADSTWVQVVVTGLPRAPPAFEYHAWTIDDEGNARFIAALSQEEGSSWKGAGLLAPKEFWPRVHVTLQAQGNPLLGIILLAPGSGAASLVSSSGELDNLPTFQFARGWVNLTSSAGRWDARLAVQRDLDYHCHGMVHFFCQHEALGFAHCAWWQRPDATAAESVRLGCWPVEDRGAVALSGAGEFGAIRFFITVENLQAGVVNVPSPFVALEQTLCEDVHGTITRACSVDD